MTPTTLDTDIGYLYDIVKNELAHGRKAHIVGTYCADINTLEELELRKGRMSGIFATCTMWKPDGTAMIATRPMPRWAIRVFEENRRVRENRWMK